MFTGIKGHTSNGGTTTLSDKSVVASEIQGALIGEARQRGLRLSRDQRAMIALPNTSESILCYCWMETFFKMIGDEIPNSSGEIHLEPMFYKDVYSEYATDLAETGLAVIGIKTFVGIWKSSFPHVKIRIFKQVTGKLTTMIVIVN